MSVRSPTLPWDLYFLSAEINLVLPMFYCCLAQVAFLFGQGILLGKTKVPARENLETA